MLETLLPSMDDHETLVKYAIDDEPASEALLNAFDAAGADLSKTETKVHDWVATDAIDELFVAEERPVHLSTMVWDYPVVLTPDHVYVFATAEMDTGTDRQELESRGGGRAAHVEQSELTGKPAATCPRCESRWTIAVPEAGPGSPFHCMECDRPFS